MEKIDLLYTIGGVLFILVIILGILIVTYFSKPFNQPHVIVHFDISGKRQPVYEDYVDEWIITIEC